MPAFLLLGVIMENRRDLRTVYVKAETEDKLQAKLFELELLTAKQAQVVSIYPRGSYVIAWVKVESKYLEYSDKEEEPKKATKKKTRKKAVKK